MVLDSCVCKSPFGVGLLSFIVHSIRVSMRVLRASPAEAPNRPPPTGLAVPGVKNDSVAPPTVFDDRATPLRASATPLRPRHTGVLSGAPDVVRNGAKTCWAALPVSGRKNGAPFPSISSHFPPFSSIFRRFPPIQTPRRSLSPPFRLPPRRIQQWRPSEPPFE